MLNTPLPYLENLKNDINLALKKSETNPIAAFDADGTCWFSDVGRDFFSYQIKKQFFPNEKSYNWNDYQKIEDESIPKGLQWLAQILKGFTLEEVRLFGEEFNQAVRPQFINHQREIIKFLIEKNVTVYIVTASVKWTVEAAAKDLGLPASQVIGIETEVLNGRISDKLKSPLTWKEGKVDALLKKTNGKKPFFVSGNTTSDVPLLHLATDVKQLIHSAKKDDDIYQTEIEALKEAKKHNWRIADFNNNFFC